MSEITALIRYKNSASTLPKVIEGIEHQTRRPDRILAVDTGSTDGSTEILRKAGADIVTWDQPYRHSIVLNFGISKCETPLVLCLSSHTTMTDPTTVEKLATTMEDENTCASSVKWDDDPFYTDLIDLEELKKKGLKFGAIYTNSLGMIRRSLWKPTHSTKSSTEPRTTTGP